MEHLHPEADVWMKSLEHTLGASNPSVLLMGCSPQEGAFGVTPFPTEYHVE